MVETVATGEWVQLTTDSPDLQTGGTRGLFMGGGPSVTDTIDFIAVDTTGDATDFVIYTYKMDGGLLQVESL